MGVSLQGLSQQDGTVTVEFGDGTAGCYDLVIGADGIHSTVRQLAVGAGAVRPVGQLAWRFVTECPPEVTTWTVLLGRDVTFLAVPIGRGQVYCYCDAPADGTPRLQGDDVTGRLAELLTGFAAPVPAILDTLGPDGAVHVAPIEEVTLDRWSQRIGAAHRGRGARDVTQHGRRRRDGPRRRPGPRRLPRLRARYRTGSGELPGSAPPTHAVGPRPDAPPGSHPQPTTRSPQPGAAQMGTEHLPRQLPPTPRSPVMLSVRCGEATARRRRLAPGPGARQGGGRPVGG